WRCVCPAGPYTAGAGRLTPPPPPGGPNPGLVGAPINVTADQLAQEHFDNPGGPGRRYGLQTLQVSGTVGRLEKPQAWEKEPGPDDLTDAVVFLIPVTNKQTGVKKQFTLRCLLKPQLPADQRKALGLQTGKPVTLRGQLLAADMNNPQASMQKCTVISAGP